MIRSWSEGAAPENMQRYTTGPEFECYVDKSTRMMGEIQLGRITYVSENGFLWGRSPI